MVGASDTVVDETTVAGAEVTAGSEAGGDPAPPAVHAPATSATTTTHAPVVEHQRPPASGVSSRCRTLPDSRERRRIGCRSVVGLCRCRWKIASKGTPHPGIEAGDDVTTMKASRGAPMLGRNLGRNGTMAVDDMPPIHFAPARGARLAYQVFGEGPETIVAIPPLAQNIEVAWEWPLIRHMHERFAQFCRYLVFDKRGTGSSDRRSKVPGIDERVSDLRAVMDHADIHRAHLYGQSEGGPMTILFAATYPDRVQSLILDSTGASLAPPWPEDERVLRRERQVAEWGTPASRMVDFFAPSLAGDQEYRSWHQRYERQSATTDSLRELLDLSAEMDVRQVLPTLEVPTLVIHRSGDRVIPRELCVELAENIPGARFLEVESNDHFAYVGDLEPWMEAIEEFVTGTVSPAPPRPPSPPAVRIVTLGRFGVEIDGEEVPTAAWGSRLARQIVKRLVAARGWPVAREELIDLLWPDEADLRRLSARLSVQLSGVRKVLGGGVVADRESVRLDLDEVSTDLEDFYRATDDRTVVAAYPGEFLPQDAYEDWTAGTRDEARARFVAAARRVAELESSHGNHLAAASLARRLLEADRYDEDAHRLLVTNLLDAGEVSEARRAHENRCGAMAELGISVERFEQLTGS